MTKLKTAEKDLTSQLQVRNDEVDHNEQLKERRKRAESSWQWLITIAGTLIGGICVYGIWQMLD